MATWRDEPDYSFDEKGRLMVTPTSGFYSARNRAERFEQTLEDLQTKVDNLDQMIQTYTVAKRKHEADIAKRSENLGTVQEFIIKLEGHVDLVSSDYEDVLDKNDAGVQSRTNEALLIPLNRDLKKLNAVLYGKA